MLKNLCEFVIKNFLRSGPLTARDTLANAGARLAASGLLGVGRGRPGGGAQQTDHEGGLPVDVRGRYATGPSLHVLPVVVGKDDWISSYSNASKQIWT
jgi:hypothetical protein